MFETKILVPPMPPKSTLIQNSLVGFTTIHEAIKITNDLQQNIHNKFRNLHEKL